MTSTSGIKKALIIGVSDYNDNQLTNLEFCKNDGEEMYNTLINLGYKIPEFQKIVGKTNKKTMEDTMIDFFRKDVHREDTLLFYFSGHGVLDGYGGRFFANTDVSSDIPEKNGVRFELLNEQMAKSPAEKKIAILDCCFSGGAVPNLTGKAVDDVEKEAENLGSESLHKVFGQSQGSCILASSLSNKRSYSLEDQSYSAFTHFIIEGLKGTEESVDDNGFVTPERLSKYVFAELQKIPKLKNQKPVRNLSIAGELILAEHIKLRKKIVSKDIANESSILVKILNGNEKDKISKFNQMRIEKSIRRPDFHKIKLTNKLLMGVNFSNADLTEADLSNSDLSGSDLSLADLSEATLTNANLAGAKLTRAILTRTIFSDTDLSEAYLESADLSDSNLSGTQLQNSILQRAELPKAIMTNSNLQGANLKFSDLSYAVLKNADLRGANLSGAVLEGSILAGTKIIHEDISNSNQNYSLFSNSEIFHRKVKEDSSDRYEPVSKIVFSFKRASEVLKRSNDFKISPTDEVWEYDNFSTTLEPEQSGKLFCMVRKTQKIYSSYMNEDSNITSMLSFSIDNFSEPIQEEYDKQSKEIHPKTMESEKSRRWKITIDSSGPIYDCSFWQSIDSDLDIKNTEIFQLYDKMKNREKLIKTESIIFNIDNKDENVIPVIYQPRIDTNKNFLREIHCCQKSSQKMEVTLVFNGMNLRRHKSINGMYKFIRKLRNANTFDLKTFNILLEKGNPTKLQFPNIFSGKDNIMYDTSHHDSNDNLGEIPSHPIKYYFGSKNHPIVFVNTSNHALAPFDNNQGLWKWEYVPWDKKSPVKFGNYSREEVIKNLRGS